MIERGLLGLIVALLLSFAFVAATVRADRRVQQVDPGSSSTFRGWPRILASASIVVALTSVVWLFGAVLGGWRQ